MSHASNIAMDSRRRNYSATPASLSIVKPNLLRANHRAPDSPQNMDIKSLKGNVISRVRNNSEKAGDDMPDARRRRKDHERGQQEPPTGLTQQDIQDLKEVFDTYDSKSKGYLSPNDVQHLLADFGLQPSLKVVYKIVAEYDPQQLGCMSYNDFLNAMTIRPHRRESRAQIEQIFRKYDQRKQGFATLSDFRDVCRRSGEKFEEQKLIEMFNKVDRDGDGKVSFEDFYLVMMRKVY